MWKALSFGALISIWGCVSTQAIELEEEKPDSLKNTSLSGLKFRSIGPGITGGRIVDIAVNPEDHSEYFVASGHGSLWKTENHGVTFSPSFEGQGSFAMGAVELDPSNPNIVWVGTGEHNNQSNVIYGDGVYRSEDGGKSWKNMGLKNSEHIGGIVIHPENSNIVYVAAYGSVRNPNEDRGVYKTTDGGKTWNKVLYVNDHTGCFEIHMDPSDPDILYASMNQRIRKDYTVLRGGPESAIYRSLDGGENWDKIMKGISAKQSGRIGLAISPADPFVIYACVEAKEGGGTYRSDDRGASWSKQSDYVTSYPFYMQKIVADPVDVNTLYGLAVKIQVSRDGGKSFSDLGESKKHVDNHALWIDPNDTRHMLSGCDGGVYETWDEAQNWDFKANMPITEIYKVSTDNAKPFYNVYIGTQDNLSLVGPSQTINSSGILNADWTFTKAGDGFESQADWKDDNIVYAQSQFGYLIRYDKQSGERLAIQPQQELDSGYRFDWDAPLLISKHDNKRLYFAAQVVFRTNDQGSSWEEISEDLTRGVPQEMYRLGGKSWSIDDMVSKGSQAKISAIAESPLNENILFVGSGDGLIHYSHDGGKTWKRSKQPEGVNSGTRIHHIIASEHDSLVAYAACHALNSGNYKPLLFKTVDGGKTWRSIASNLPERGSTFSIAEDHMQKGLLFVGTQFGLYVSVDDGQEWIKFMNGLPTTTIMDMEIHRGENDLVVSTFGRGVYILDDYSPLRKLNNETVNESLILFDTPDALMYIEANPFGYSGVSFQGASMYSAPNPEIGATFTYYLKEGHESLKDKRQKEEKELKKKDADIEYPDYETLKAEQKEQEPYLLFTISDESGNVIRKMKRNLSKGLQRFTWDLRYDGFGPFVNTNDKDHKGRGYMVAPGTYHLSMHKYDGKAWTQLIDKHEFLCVPLNNTTIPVEDIDSLIRFNEKVAELLRVVQGAEGYRKEMEEDVDYILKAVLFTHTVPKETQLSIREVEERLTSLNEHMNGDPLRTRYEGAGAPTTRSRIQNITWALWSTRSAPTQTFIRQYELARADVDAILDEIRSINAEIEKLRELLDEYQAPYTPGRIPEFKE